MKCNCIYTGYTFRKFCAIVLSGCGIPQAEYTAKADLTPIYYKKEYEGSDKYIDHRGGVFR